WHQDRAAMKGGHWSGIVGKGNAYEDFAVQESMGPIVDRSQEFLASCDHVIIRARSQLLRAIHRFQATGEVAFAGPDVDWRRFRAISYSSSHGEDRRRIDAFAAQPLAAAE